jgi:hypothetical protein
MAQQPLAGQAVLFMAHQPLAGQAVLFMAQQPLAGQAVLIIEALRSHSDTPHSVGLLRTSYQPEPETCI